MLPGLAKVLAPVPDLTSSPLLAYTQTGCRSGGIGRRTRLKIWRGLKPRAGSNPASGTTIATLRWEWGNWDSPPPDIPLQLRDGVVKSSAAWLVANMIHQAGNADKPLADKRGLAGERPARHLEATRADRGALARKDLLAGRGAGPLSLL